MQQRLFRQILSALLALVLLLTFEGYRWSVRCETNRKLYTAITTCNERQLSDLLRAGTDPNSRIDDPPIGLWDRIRVEIAGIRSWSAGKREDMRPTALEFAISKPTFSYPQGEGPAAGRDRRRAIVERLIAAGADIHRSGSHGMLPLALAAFFSNNTAAKALLLHKSPVNGQDNRGKSALMYAAERENADLVIALLHAGASITDRDIGGDRALDIACNRPSEPLRVITALVDARSDVNLPNGGGITPLIEAIRVNRPDVARLLLRHGAELSKSVGADLELSGQSPVELDTPN